MKLIYSETKRSKVNFFAISSLLHFQLGSYIFYWAVFSEWVSESETPTSRNQCSYHQHQTHHSGAYPSWVSRWSSNDMSSEDARDNQITRCHSNFWLSLCTERTICTVRTLVQLRNASPASSKRRCETTKERESREVRPSLGNRDYYFMRLWRCRHRYDLSHVLKYCTTVKK